MQTVTSVHEDLLSLIDQIEKDQDLYVEKNFILRSQAIDDIEFHLLDFIQVRTQIDGVSEILDEIGRKAEQIRTSLEEVNTKMFLQIRNQISEGRNRKDDFLKLLHKYFEPHLTASYSDEDFLMQDNTGYDYLDLFINGLLSHRNLPDETKEREAEMVFYQKTPARIILQMIRQAEIKSSDIFVDLGSGLGQVVMLVSLLTAAQAKGIEVEPAYIEYSRAGATELGLAGTEFIRTDARNADYSEGTIFFLYTPFEGKILQDVLQQLKEESKNRIIKIFSYGPCTATLATQEWLRKKYFTTNEGLAEFESLT